LQSCPAGALIAFGIFVGQSLLGVAVLGVGPANVHRLFRGADRNQVVCLSRFWLDDRLGRNCESRTLAIILRHLKRDQQTIKALVAYSDPQAGHTGTVYRAAGFGYLGLSTAMPRYRLPDGKDYHPRSLSQTYGSRSRKHFAVYGVDVELVQQIAKHTYVTFIDPSWRSSLTRPLIPYSNKEQSNGNS
jgi:hypothetical protein